MPGSSMVSSQASSSRIQIVSLYSVPFQSLRPERNLGRQMGHEFPPNLIREIGGDEFSPGTSLSPLSPQVRLQTCHQGSTLWQASLPPIFTSNCLVRHGPSP